MRFFLTTLVMALGGSILLAQPSISFIQPTPPANMTRVLGQRCPGELCIEDCVFALSNLSVTVVFESDTPFNRELVDARAELIDSNGSEIADTFVFLVGNKRTNTFSWSGTKAVTCGNNETLSVRVIALEVYRSSIITNFTRNTNTLFYKLVCVPCETPTRTEPSGHTTVPHSTADRVVRVGGMVMNLAHEPQEITVQALSSAGFTLVPDTLTLPLASGEGAEVFFDVQLPGGLIDGSAGTVTVQSQIDAVPDSQSSATMELRVATPMVLRLASFSAADGVTLELMGPWERMIVIEFSEDLIEWHKLAELSLPVGAETLTIPDDAKPGPARFYRAWFQADGTLRKSVQ